MAAAELAVGLVAAVRGQVLPEDRVVDVAAEVERQVLLVQAVDRAKVALVAGLGQLGEGVVGPGDVGGVVLAVVQLHDLAGDVRLERRRSRSPAPAKCTQPQGSFPRCNRSVERSRSFSTLLHGCAHRKDACTLRTCTRIGEDQNRMMSASTPSRTSAMTPARMRAIDWPRV